MSAKRDILAEIHGISHTGYTTYYSAAIYDTAQDLAEHVLCQQNNPNTSSVLVVVAGLSENIVAFSGKRGYSPSPDLWDRVHPIV